MSKNPVVEIMPTRIGKVDKIACSDVPLKKGQYVQSESGKPYQVIDAGNGNRMPHLGNRYLVIVLKVTRS